jgi:transcriptional regulator with XRE-family HTH domain
MSILGDRLRELRGATSQSEMARELEMARPQWIRYENGTSIPGADILEKICRVHACSADWLLGLKDNATPTATARGKGAIAVAGSNNAVNTGGDCSKCKLMKAHLREITGRKKIKTHL